MFILSVSENLRPPANGSTGLVMMLPGKLLSGWKSSCASSCAATTAKPWARGGRRPEVLPLANCAANTCPKSTVPWLSGILLIVSTSPAARRGRCRTRSRMSTSLVESGCGRRTYRKAAAVRSRSRTTLSMREPQGSSRKAGRIRWAPRPCFLSLSPAMSLPTAPPGCCWSKWVGR